MWLKAGVAIQCCPAFLFFRSCDFFDTIKSEFSNKKIQNDKQMDQFERESKLAEEGARKKGFIKDLFWGLLVYNILFVGLGVVMFYYPEALWSDGEKHPYSSMVLFSFALVIDMVTLWHYVRYNPKKGD